MTSKSASRGPNGTNGKESDSDVIRILKDDHKLVRRLLADLTAAETSDERRDLFERAATEIRIHSAVEEEIFYPAYFEAASKKEDSKLYYEAKEEHGVVAAYLIEMEHAAPTSDEFPAKAKVLKDLIEHHADEEEEEMMPRARKLLEKEELHVLGTRVAARKHELQNAPAKPGAPRR